MNIRDDDQVSAVALVMETEAATGAPVADEPPAAGNGKAPAAESAGGPPTPEPNGHDGSV
jgi:hypothetical protein